MQPPASVMTLAPTSKNLDSFTQIILGAACGEAVAGKKLGNRAMLWGAVGGTIPDLDVFASFFTDELTSTAFHRGFMHSFLFAVLAPWLLAQLAVWFYKQDIYRKRGYKAFALSSWLLMFTGALIGINFIPVIVRGHISFYTLVPTLLLAVWFYRKTWRDYWVKTAENVEVSYFTWVLLFFWSIFTHPILDCFTSWGTQIWQPFADTRVQWCTVSVVDPVCTMPFAICLWIAARYARASRMRSIWNWAGIVWFCGYLCLYTVWHKMTVNAAFNSTLHAKNIDFKRIYTNPTIFNNIVWYGIAESDTAYYFGQYGFNDRNPAFNKISVLPKNHLLLQRVPADDRVFKFIQWFTDGYYTVQPWNGDTLQVNDLRFGLLGDTLNNNNYVFPFLIFKNGKGQWDLKQNGRNKAGIEKSKKSFGELWERIKGDR